MRKRVILPQPTLLTIQCERAPNLITTSKVSDTIRLLRNQLTDSDGQVVGSLRAKMAKTDRWIDRALREDAREAVGNYLAKRDDSHPWLFISQSRRTKFLARGPLIRSAAHQIIKKYLAMIYAASLI
jgi:hypothetical protein